MKQALQSVYRCKAAAAFRTRLTDPQRPGLDWEQSTGKLRTKQMAPRQGWGAVSLQPWQSSYHSGGGAQMEVPHVQTWSARSTSPMQRKKQDAANCSDCKPVFATTASRAGQAGNAGQCMLMPRRQTTICAAAACLPPLPAAAARLSSSCPLSGHSSFQTAKDLMSWPASPVVRHSMRGTSSLSPSGSVSSLPNSGGRMICMHQPASSPGR